MSSGTPARVKSLRPSFSSIDRRGGLGVAGGGQEGVRLRSSESRMIKEVLPVDEAGGGDDHQEELDTQVEEEADVARPLPTPEMPTRSEFEDHCVTHVPYRTWCNRCVEGRGREAGHSRQSNEGRSIPTVSFDHALVGDKEEITIQEQTDVEEGSVKIFVVRDLMSKAVFAHVVPKKGLDDKGVAVDAIVGDIKWLGYTRVMLKSDNEPAILKLLVETLRELGINGLEQS